MVSLTVDVSGLVDGPTSYIDAADVSTPVGQLKTHLENTLNGVQAFDQLAFAAEGTALGIVSDAITISRTAHRIDTEALAATDNLSTINGGVVGDVLLLRSSSAARVVTLKHGVGNIRTGNLADIPLDQVSDVALLVYDGTNWNVVSPNSATGVIDVYGLSNPVASQASVLNFIDAGNGVEYSAPFANIYSFQPTIAEGRLTGVSGDPTGVTGSPTDTVYYTPYIGNRMAVYDGTRWRMATFSELSIKLEQAQTGTTTNSSAVITGLASTQHLAVGMLVTGTFIPGASFITSVNSPTSITINAPATGGASVTLTFKVPANRPVDLLMFWTGSALAMQMLLWTSDSSRGFSLATLSGVYVVSGVPTHRYLGTIRTNGTDGRTEDTLTKRLIWNVQNQVQRKFLLREATASWTYNSATWRSLNNSTANRVEFVRGLNDKLVRLDARAQVGWSTGGGGSTSGHIGIGLDVTNANSADVMQGAHFATGGTSTLAGMAASLYEGLPAVGYHFLQLVESVGLLIGSTVAATFYGSSVWTGGVGWVWG